MEKPILLLYVFCGKPSYEWFDTIEEMNEYVDDGNFKVFEAWEIHSATKIL